MKPTIIDKVKASIEPIVGAGNYHYADSYDLNVILDNAQFPCAFSNLVATGTAEDQAGRFFERITLQVWFANLSEEGLDGIENERIIQPLKEKAFTWLSALRQNDELALESVNNTGRYYIQNSGLDVLATAFVVDVTIREKEGYGVCGK